MLEMKETDTRKIITVSFATQLVTLVILSLVQASLGYSFCLENQQCIVNSVKVLLMTLFLSILAGWISSGTHVVEIGSDAVFTISKQKVYGLIKALFITFCGSFVFHFITILYGAPFIEKMEETYLFSCLMALVTLFNLMLFSNGKWWTIFQILDFQLYKTGKIVDSVRLVSFLSIVGALFGSAAIPLDWDRPWQAWPVPCCFGATLGYTIGLMVFIILHIVDYIKCRHEQSKMKYY